jgi:uncharacterized membrane protein
MARRRAGPAERVGFGQRIRRYLIAGLLVWIPLAITLWVINLIVGAMDQSLELVPPRYQPDLLIGLHIPGIGVVLTILVLLVTGVLVSNIVGQRLVRFWESLLARIPFVKSVYSSVKQVSDTLFAPSGQAFRKALLIQWPRDGVWTIAFLTGTPAPDVAKHLQGDYISVYVPTTPNPTGGYFVMLPRASTIELDMSVDEALKYIISMGVAAPDARQLKAAPGADAGDRAKGSR